MMFRGPFQSLRFCWFCGSVKALPACNISYWHKQFTGMVNPTTFHIFESKVCFSKRYAVAKQRRGQHRGNWATCFGMRHKEIRLDELMGPSWLENIGAHRQKQCLSKTIRRLKKKNNSISAEQRLLERSRKTPQVFADQPWWTVNLSFGNWGLVAWASCKPGLCSWAQQDRGNSFIDTFYVK